MNQTEGKKIWGFIYLFTICGKGYVGQTPYLKKRFKRHFKEQKKNPRFHNFLRKHFSDPESSFKILECWKRNGRDLEEFKKLLDSREIFWTEKLRTFDPEQKKGWNLNKGGGGSLGRTKEKSPSWGKKRPDIVEKNRQRVGIKSYWFGKTGENHPIFGIKRPDVIEKNKKMSGKLAPCYGRTKEKHPLFGKTGINCATSKPVILISPEGIEYKLPCYTPFCKEYHLSTGGICNVLQGKQKSYKGWTGYYLKNE